MKSMEKKLMAILKNGQLEFDFVEDNLKSYYKILECDLIQVIQLKINGVNYNFIIDDEGKLKENYINIILIHKEKIIDEIVGHIIIQKYDYENDEVKHLTNFDQMNIQKWFNECKILIDFSRLKKYKTLEI